MSKSVQFILLLVLLLMLVGLGGIQLAVYYPWLPENVASHFDGKGNADGYSSKTTFVGLLLAVQLGMSGLMILLSWGLKYMPVSLINMPNKEYWLAPERRDESFADMNCGLMIMGAATQVLMLVITQLVIWENLGQRGMSGATPWVTIGLYLTFTVGFCIWMTRRFHLPPQPLVQSTSE